MPKLNKAQCGRLGGLTTVARHGKEHMSRIGKKGAETTWTRYKISPVGLTSYAMVEVETNRIVAVIGSGR